MVVDILNTNNKYDIVYTDPAWQQKKGGLRKSRPNQTRQLDYQTCTIEQIKEIQKQAMTLCNEKHNVFMWTIDKYLFEAEKMMKELGYELHARFIWDKQNGVAPAFTVRFSHEYLLWFYPKGKMLKPCKEQRGKYLTVMREQATKHSKKPLCAYEMLETMFPETQKIELFARNERCGWDCWGNEVVKEMAEGGNGKILQSN